MEFHQYHFGKELSMIKEDFMMNWEDLTLVVLIAVNLTALMYHKVAVIVSGLLELRHLLHSYFPLKDTV